MRYTDMNRRNFVRALGAGTIAAGALGAAPGVFTSHAADTSGYKALVCVFLFGGLDNNDLIIPFDPSSYDSWRTIRQSFVSRQGQTRDRSALLPLSRVSDPNASGPQFALPPEMPQVKALYDAGNAAVVANVGPLVEPVTRSSFEAGAVRVPPRLFSHNDQQNVWQAGAPEGAQFGWGGLFADAIIASGANGNREQFTTIATDEVGPFLTGRRASPYRVDVGGAAELTVIEDIIGSDTNIASQIRERLGAGGFAQNHIIERDIANKFGSGLDTNDLYGQALSQGSTQFTGFGEGPLAAQLRAVARTIAIRDRLVARRQIFFVGLGGFDTHSAQAVDLPGLLGQLDGAVGSFFNAMNALGLANDVALFTASDFGRTLAVNGDGTDHGWGGHHLVMGGAVKGREIYGEVPPPVLGHSQEVGGGRLIPSLAVDQYAEQLGRWFGLNAEEIGTALPNLGRFTRPDFEFI